MKRETQVVTLQDLLIGPTLIVFEKRAIEAPQVDLDYVRSLVGEKDFKFALSAIENLKRFLVVASPIGDQFGADHPSRRTWRKKNSSLDRLERESEVYRRYRGSQNQFRANTLHGARISIESLACYIKKDETVYEKLENISQSLFDRFNGLDPKTKERVAPHYNEIESLHQKLEIVHFYEDQVVAALNLLSPSCKA